MRGLQAGEYKVTSLVQGFPGKSDLYGFLGWSTVVLIQSEVRTVLLDTGSMGMRKVLIANLARLGVQPHDVTDVLLTHSHHDHSINWPLFSRARIHISELELDWALAQPWGATSVPEFSMQELQRSSLLRVVRDGDEVVPGINAVLAQGHTPGSMAYHLRCREGGMIFVGDAVKSRAELLCGFSDTTNDAAASALSIQMLCRLWSQNESAILVPGHDIPMAKSADSVSYVEAREASIRVWFGDDLDSSELIQLG
jgi:N-acyl homoserine lactone hydrolase